MHNSLSSYCYVTFGTAVAPSIHHGWQNWCGWFGHGWTNNFWNNPVLMLRNVGGG